MLLYDTIWLFLIQPWMTILPVGIDEPAEIPSEWDWDGKLHWGMGTRRRRSLFFELEADPG
ncbi:hypothetical protein TIFTF001_012884 [Ficus carica]|uniref:Uncharacterized protein n=1 Tax=Ficus carica TaxID=3494 RepID=A0AA88DI57_FICCA|nr:hypothetical protein TIFTF001_012884 [Ficus carica]